MIYMLFTHIFYPSAQASLKKLNIVKSMSLGAHPCQFRAENEILLCVPQIWAGEGWAHHPCIAIMLRHFIIGNGLMGDSLRKIWDLIYAKTEMRLYQKGNVQCLATSYRQNRYLFVIFYISTLPDLHGHSWKIFSFNDVLSLFFSAWITSYSETDLLESLLSCIQSRSLVYFANKLLTSLLRSLLFIIV